MAAAVFVLASSAMPVYPGEDGEGATGAAKTSRQQPRAEERTDNRADESIELELNNGAKLAIESYGDRYDAYTWRRPSRAEDAEVFLDYRATGWDGLYLRAVKIDAKNRRIYWIDTTFSWTVGNIRSANLKRGRVRTVVDGLKDPRGLAIDIQHSRLYWANGYVERGTKNNIQRCALDGAHLQTIVEGIRQPGAISLDGEGAFLFYFDENNLIRAQPDGSHEAKLANLTNVACAGWEMAVDNESRKLYWTGGDHRILRANLDGSGIEESVNVGYGAGKIASFAIDSRTGKIYWVDASYGNLRRANLDGSRVEELVNGLSNAGGIDIDPVANMLYWTESRSINGSIYGIVRRTKIPAIPEPMQLPAPPEITSISPLSEAARKAITISGRNLGGATKVIFVDNTTGRNVVASFTVRSNEAISAIVPSLSEECRRAAIVVLTPGGATVTLLKSARIVAQTGAAFSPLYARYDRFADADASEFVVLPKGLFAGIESSVAYMSGAAYTDSGGRGRATLFMKNGSFTVASKLPNCAIYHEPFAIINFLDRIPEGTKLVPVPAIRPSLCEELFRPSKGD